MSAKHSGGGDDLHAIPILLFAKAMAAFSMSRLRK
jgi:hypothetical protein